MLAAHDVTTLESMCNLAICAVMVMIRLVPEHACARRRPLEGQAAVKVRLAD